MTSMALSEIKDKKSMALSEILKSSSDVNDQLVNQSMIYSSLQCLEREDFFKIIKDDLLLRNYIAFRKNFKSFDDSTVVHMLFKCSVINNEYYKRSHYNTIQSIFETLCNVPEIHFIFKLVAELNYKIIFDYTSQANTQIASDEIKCPLSDDDETLGFLIYKLTVLAMQETYENDGKPYYSDNKYSRKNHFDELLSKLAEDVNFKQYFPGSVAHVEILPRFFQLLLQYETGPTVSIKLMKLLQPLFNFYFKFTVEDMKSKTLTIPFVTGNF